MWREERASRWAKGRLEKESNIKAVKKAIIEINHKSKPKETGNRNRYDQDVPQEASLTVISQQKTICPGLNNLTFKKKKGKKFNSLKCEQYDNGFMSLTSTNRKQGTMELLLFTPGFSSDAIPLSVSVDVPLSASLTIYLKERGQVRLVHCPTRGHVQSVRLSGIQSGQMSLG